MNGIQDQVDIVGLSGTSGGAITAAQAWVGLLKRAQGDTAPIGDRIIACWKDLSAQTPQEIMFDKVCIDLLRLVEHGFLPSVARSPSSPPFQFWARMTAAMLGRPEFTDLRALLLKHIDFQELPERPHPGGRVDGTLSRPFRRRHARADRRALHPHVAGPAAGAGLREQAVAAARPHRAVDGRR